MRQSPRDARPSSTVTPFDVAHSADSDVLERTEPETADYIRRGESEGVSTGYLASRRDPWYSLDGRETAPFLCTYMDRSANGQPPFKITLNESRPVATNVHLMLYPKDPLRKRMATTSRRRAVLAILNRILDKEWRTSRRAYGAANPRGDRPHSSRRRTGNPGNFWCTYTSRFPMKPEACLSFFAAVDHCASDVVACHVAKTGH